MPEVPIPACPVCGGPTTAAGSKHSSFSGRDFTLGRCSQCDFLFVCDPRSDFAAIYDEDYYRGRGADPSVDYVYEAEHRHSTIRRHEWRGVLRVVAGLVDVGPGTNWLDYGCGAGGLVSYLRDRGVAAAIGFEQGWSAERLVQRGVPRLTEAQLSARKGEFDVVTAIEVLEHVPDPVAELARIRSLLRPGGLLFLTTGNNEPYRDRAERWSYVLPEVHVSFFSPRSLALAMERAGLEPAFPGFRPGWDDIIRFKILKALGRKQDGRLSRIIPWSVVARLVDHRLRLSAHPVGWAAVNEPAG